jgi:hypothetical protein
MNLYDLTQKFRDLRELADSTEPEELGECFHSAMADADMSIAQKFESICMVIRELEAIEEARCSEAARLRVRAKHAANAVERLKGMMGDTLRVVSPESLHLKCGIFEVKIAKNGGKQPIKLHDDDVPDVWKKATLSPDMELIRVSLEKGEPLGFAQLEPRGEHVRIR